MAKTNKEKIQPTKTKNHFLLHPALGIFTGERKRKAYSPVS